MKRIGIFGGTFNPPHIAHLIMADDVREQMHLDKILFIPSGNPPLKDGSEVISACHRLNMAKLSFENDVHFEVSDIELKNTGKKSYTVNTLMKLREVYEDEQVKFYLILGIDNLIDFPKWKDPQKLFLLSEVVIINRPGFFVQDVLPEYSGMVKFLSVPMLDISSTLVRDYVAHKKSIKYLVTPEVEIYIKDNKLYLN